ncbi:MAG: helix-turn-helix domain-containing protein [Pseudomonadota bacterium]
MLPIGVHTEAEALLCPIRTVLSKVTGKWQIIVVLALEDGPLRFGALKRTIGDITQGVLTENLRSLQKDGYITRTVEPGPPIAVYYALTPVGEGLVNLLRPLVLWANDNMEGVKDSRQEYEEASQQMTRPG